MSKISQVTILIQTEDHDDPVDVVETLMEETEQIKNYEIISDEVYGGDNFTEVYSRILSAPK